MTVKEYVLDGLEAELELERELGVRSIEIDRSLLISVPEVPRSTAAKTALPKPAPKKIVYDFIFVHDRRFTADAQVMMEKIVHAMGKDRESAPIVFEAPLPKAKVTVVLGGRALKKFFPSVRGEPGMMVSTDDGRQVCITYSPEYILKFGTITPAVDKLKRIMWNNLKAVMQKVR